MNDKFSTNSNRNSSKNLNRILKYIKGIKQFKLIIKRKEGSESIIAYSDAVWDSDLNRKSVNSMVKQKQAIVPTSSSEAEYIALSAATSEAIWIKGILEDMFVVETYTGYLCWRTIKNVYLWQGVQNKKDRNITNY